MVLITKSFLVKVLMEVQKKAVFELLFLIKERQIYSMFHRIRICLCE